jgi:cell division protein FtsB
VNHPFDSRGEWVRALGLGIAAIAILGVSALLDQESGFEVWRNLDGDLSISLGRVAELKSQNESMRREIEMLEAEPAAIDRAIREELDLALPGEIIVRFRKFDRRNRIDDRIEKEPEERGFSLRSIWPDKFLRQERK